MVAKKRKNIIYGPLISKCYKTNRLIISCFGYPGLHDNPWLCDCQISMVMTLSMSVGSPVVLMDQLLMCSRSLGQSGMLLTQAQLSRCMRPSVQPAATRVISPLGSNVILRCDATGYPTPTLTWIKTSTYTGKQSSSTLWDKAIFTQICTSTSPVNIWLSLQIVAKKPCLTLTSYLGTWRAVSSAIFSIERKKTHPTLKMSFTGEFLVASKCKTGLGYTVYITVKSIFIC